MKNEISMSAFVHVRHFFSPEGVQAFPRLFEEHRRSVSAFAGFVSLRRSPPVKGDHASEREMTLEFADESLLQKWRSSPEHAQVGAAYRPFWIREPQLTFSTHD
jgi:heme-degrading monooxygenase HmoA